MFFGVGLFSGVVLVDDVYFKNGNVFEDVVVVD